MKFNIIIPTKTSFSNFPFLRLKRHAANINRRLRVFAEPLLQPIFPTWSALRNRARVQKIESIGDNYVRLCLKTPFGWGSFHPGQHVQMGVVKNGAQLLRCFSISSSVQRFRKERTIDLTIQVQNQGQVTPWIKRFLKVGHTVTLSKASGDFIIDSKRPALLIAGGSGVTPFHSFIAGTPSRPTVLLHYSKNPSLFSNHKHSENLNVQRFDTSKRGRFSLEDLETHCPDFRTFEIYLCGPGNMIEHVRAVLLEQDCDPKQIHTEYFGTVPKNDNWTAESDGTLVHFSKSGAKAFGDKRNLLELAESVGLKPVFGCRIGVCHQCKCSKKQGVVYNTRTQQYSDSGEEDIQLCVSIPVFNDVVINL